LTLDVGELIAQVVLDLLAHGMLRRSVDSLQDRDSYRCRAISNSTAC